MSAAPLATCWLPVLSRHVGLRGVLFDLPHVVRDAPSLLKTRGVDSRVTIEPGSFFERVPADGDAYLLSHIIHDWSEEQCLTILGHCRRAMRTDSRLLIVETVLPEGNAPHQGKLQDLVMLVFPGGQERTEAGSAALLGKAGFRLRRVVPTTSVVSIVEAVPNYLVVQKRRTARFASPRLNVEMRDDERVRIGQDAATARLSNRQTLTCRRARGAVTAISARRRGHRARGPPLSPWRRRCATEGRSRRGDRAPARTAATRVRR